MLHSDNNPKLSMNGSIWEQGIQNLLNLQPWETNFNYQQY